MTEPTASRLKIVCAAAGRDGTLSASKMIADVFAQEGLGRTVMHEYCAREFLHCFTDFVETGEERYREQARVFIRECPFDCIVGVGPAPWIGLFRELLGPELRVVHLRRRDRARAVASLSENARLFPLAYGYYADSPRASWRRFAAFHYKEMSREAWFSLGIEERIGWYFDKTHALIEAALPAFTNTWTIYTEDLNSQEARASLAMAAGAGGFVPAAKHINSHAFVHDTPAEHRDYAQWLLGQFDVQLAARDEVYPLEYFANALIAWTGYQVRRAPQIVSGRYPEPDAIRANLARARAASERLTALIGALERETDERYPLGDDPS